jgi:hypothetical protein
MNKRNLRAVTAKLCIPCGIVFRAPAAQFDTGIVYISFFSVIKFVAFFIKFVIFVILLSKQLIIF